MFPSNGYASSFNLTDTKQNKIKLFWQNRRTDKNPFLANPHDLKNFWYSKKAVNCFSGFCFCFFHNTSRTFITYRIYIFDKYKNYFWFCIKLIDLIENLLDETLLINIFAVVNIVLSVFYDSILSL